MEIESAVVRRDAARHIFVMLQQAWLIKSVYQSVDMEFNAFLLLAVGIAAAANLLWELYLSPLVCQCIPGPKWAAASDLWHYWVQVRLRRTFTFHELSEVRVYPERMTWMRYSLNDQRYGPVVRVGPNRVIFRNIDAGRRLPRIPRSRVQAASRAADNVRCGRTCRPAWRGCHWIRRCPDSITTRNLIPKREAWAAAVRTEQLSEEGGDKHVSSAAPLVAKKRHEDNVAKKNSDHIVKVLRQDVIIT